MDVQKNKSSRISISNMRIGKKMRNVRFEGVNPVRERNIVIVSLLQDDDSSWFNKEEATLIVFKTFTKRYGWNFLIKPYWELAIWNGWRYTKQIKK